MTEFGLLFFAVIAPIRLTPEIGETTELAGR